MDTFDIKMELCKETKKWFDVANQKLNREFSYPFISFLLRGTCAGKAYTYKNEIHYNLGIAKDNFNHFVSQTVPHEVAHIVADKYFGRRCIHGREWRWVMQDVFGKEPTRCHSYDVTNHRARKTKTYLYQCSCLDGCRVGAKHHKVIGNTYAQIHCKKCKFILNPSLLIRELVQYNTA